MSSEQNAGGSSGTSVVADQLRFKLKLNIGEDAYNSLRIKKYLLDAMDAGNGVAAGVTVASSSVIAGTFFAPTGFLAMLGIGAATTPIGWAVAAGAIGAGLSVAFDKYFVRGSSSRVSTIPKFLNTPLDTLALGLFDLIASLSLKLAKIDGQIDSRERAVISNYFIQEWGYNEAFVSVALAELELGLDEFTLQSVANRLANFKKTNPDCNYDAMVEETIAFLHQIAEADDFFDEREEMGIQRVKAIFEEANRISFNAQWKACADALRTSSEVTTNAISRGTKSVSAEFKSLIGKFKHRQ